MPTSSSFGINKRTELSAAACDKHRNSRSKHEKLLLARHQPPVRNNTQKLDSVTLPLGLLEKFQASFNAADPDSVYGVVKFLLPLVDNCSDLQLQVIAGRLKFTNFKNDVSAYDVCSGLDLKSDKKGPLFLKWYEFNVSMFQNRRFSFHFYFPISNQSLISLKTSIVPRVPN